MSIHGRLKNIFIAQSGQLLPLPPVTPPLTSPFPVNLPNGGTVNLALLNVRSAGNRSGAFLSATVNWSATFIPPDTPAVLNVPGFADVTFEILLNNIAVIYRVAQTAVQKGFPLIQPSFLFTIAVPTYEIASLGHFDRSLPVEEHRVYTLRATNISLTAPQVAAGTAVTTAQVGAVTFTALTTKGQCSSVF